MTSTALGASGLPGAADRLLAATENADREQLTAAADGLLRCAEPRHGAALADLRAVEWLSPEARYSLDLLIAELDAAAPDPEPPPGLDPAERVRRDQWRAQRAAKPADG